MMEEHVEELMCLVCMSFQDHQSMIKLLPCNHLFCKPCMKNWSMGHVSCPLDRIEILNLSIYNPRKQENELISVKSFIMENIEDSIKSDIEQLMPVLIEQINVSKKINEIFTDMDKQFNYDIMDKYVKFVTHGSDVMLNQFCDSIRNTIKHYKLFLISNKKSKNTRGFQGISIIFKRIYFAIQTPGNE